MTRLQALHLRLIPVEKIGERSLGKRLYKLSMCIIMRCILVAIDLCRSVKIWHYTEHLFAHT